MLCGYLRCHRASNRDPEKIPASSAGILEWGKRYKLKNNFNKFNCKLDYNFIDFFIVSSKNKDLFKCGKIEFSNKTYTLLKNI